MFQGDIALLGFDNYNGEAITHCDKCGKKFRKNQSKHSQRGEDGFYCSKCFYND